MRRALPLLIALLAAPPAVAAPSRLDAETREAVAAAGRHFSAGRYAEALDALRRIEDRVPEDASVRWNIARCLEELGRPREAIAAFERARALSADDADRDAADGRIAALRARLPGALWIVCEGGTVRVDGLDPAACPARWDAVPPGRRAGRVEGPGGARGFTAVVRPDEVTRLRVEAPAPAAVEGPARWPAWVAVALAAGAAAGGVVAMRAADEAAAEAAGAAERGRYDGLRADYDRATTLGYAAYGVSAALLGLGAWLWLDPPGGDGAQAHGWRGGASWTVRW